MLAKCLLILLRLTSKKSGSSAATSRHSIGPLRSGAGASPPATLLESHEISQISGFGGKLAPRSLSVAQAGLNCRNPASATPREDKLETPP